MANEIMEEKNIMSYEFSNKREYELIPAGTYEVILDTVEIKVAKNSQKEYLSCTYRIRDDVEQACAGRLLFESIFRDKTDPTVFNKRLIHNILLSQGEKGKYKFEDEEEIIQHINGLYMQVYIENNPADEFHNEPYNRIKFGSQKETKFPPQTIGSTSKIDQQYGLNVDDDEDLPF